MSRLRAFTVATAIISLVGASTSAIAASPVGASVSAPAAASAAGSWGTLSAMSGSSAAAAAAVAQDNDGRGIGGISWLSLAVILATIAVGIYIITKDDNDDLDFNIPPISPT